MKTSNSTGGKPVRLGERAAMLFRPGLWAFLGAVLVSSLTTAAEKPNILLLLSDDHSYPFVGCYGNGNVRTPTLDRLAAEGMKFIRLAPPLCITKKETDEALEIFEGAITMAEKEQGLL